MPFEKEPQYRFKLLSPDELEASKREDEVRDEALRSGIPSEIPDPAQRAAAMRRALDEDD